MKSINKLSGQSYEIVSGPAGQLVIVDDRTVRYDTGKYLSLSTRGVRNSMWNVLGYGNERVLKTLRDTPVWEDYLRTTVAREEYYMIVKEINPTLHQVVSVFTDPDYYNEALLMHNKLANKSDWSITSDDSDNIIYYLSQDQGRYIKFWTESGFISEVTYSQGLYQLHYYSNLVGRRSSYYLFDDVISEDNYLLTMDDILDIDKEAKLTVGEAEMLFKYLVDANKIDDTSLADLYNSLGDVGESSSMDKLLSIYDDMIKLRDSVTTVAGSKYLVMPYTFSDLVGLINSEVNRLVPLLSESLPVMAVELATRAARANKYLLDVKTYNSEVVEDIISQVNSQ